MSTPEGKVKAKIKAYLKTLPGCWFFMPIGGAYSTHGAPDIVGLIHGRMFAIECKAPGKANNTTVWQRMTLQAILDAGGVAFVATDVETVKARLEEALLVTP